MRTREKGRGTQNRSQLRRRHVASNSAPISSSGVRVGREPDVVAGAERLDQGRGRLAAEPAARAAHGGEAGEREKRAEPGAVLARAHERVGRPAAAVAPHDLGGEEEPVVPEHHGDGLVLLRVGAQVVRARVETQRAAPQPQQQAEGPEHGAAPAAHFMDGRGWGGGGRRRIHGRAVVGETRALAKRNPEGVRRASSRCARRRG
jgi:hypothetical protein